MVFFHPCRDEPEIRAATLDHLVEMRDKAVCHRVFKMVGEAMCLYDGTSDVVYVEREEGSKNRSLRNTCDQVMCLDTSPPQATLKDPDHVR